MKEFSKEEVVSLFEELKTVLDIHSNIDMFCKEKGLIEEEFEVGEWYKYKLAPKSLFCLTEIRGENNNLGYGINYLGKWVDADNCKGWTISNETYKATDKEVKESLIKEAKRIGFKEGVIIDSTNVGFPEQKMCEVDSNVFNFIEGELHINDWLIFVNGKWATIVEEELTTDQRLERIEKELKIR